MGLVLGNTWYERLGLKWSRSYVEKCVDRMNVVFDPHEARKFFKLINPKFKTVEKVKECWDKYRATVLGISVEAYKNSEGLEEFNRGFPLERYLAEHGHTLKEVDGRVQILFNKGYTDWSEVWARYQQLPAYQGKPSVPWKYGEDGVQKKDMYDWTEFTPYKKVENPEWGNRYIFEFCVSCTDARLRTSGDHSWFRLKTPAGDIYSVGKNLERKIDKKWPPFQMKKGYFMSPDVSEYWPQAIHRLEVEITQEQFKEIKQSVEEDKRHEADETFQIFNKNCQEYVNCKAAIAGLKLPTAVSVVHQIVPEPLHIKDVESPSILRRILNAVGAFFVNGLLLFFGNGHVDRTVHPHSEPHLKIKDIFNREKLRFHPPTYVAQKVFPMIREWRGNDESKKYQLPQNGENL